MTSKQIFELNIAMQGYLCESSKDIVFHVFTSISAPDLLVVIVNLETNLY